MKKKIINGILMVALLAATTTSFVSCKDNDEDVKTDLLAQLNKQAGDLQTKWETADSNLETALKTWVNNQDFATHKDVHDSISNLKQYVRDSFATKSQLADSMLAVGKKLDSLGLQIDTIKMDIAALKLDVDTLKDRMNAAELRLDTLETDIDNILATLMKMVTSVTVNATSNSILSNSKVFPGLNIQFVGAAYGEPITPKGSFPSKETGLSDAALAGVESLAGYYTWKDGDFIKTNDGEKFDAGKIFFTINPSNVNPKDLKSLTLVNSLQKEYFTIDKESIKPCEEELTWGVTRAEEYKANLWEANVKYDATTVKAIDLKNVINFSAIKNNVKTIIDEAKSIDKSNAKENSKAIIKETAQVVANLLNAKLPAMPAVALKATWQDTVGVRSVLSDYSIAATAYKPLSFNELNADSKNYIDFTKLDNSFAKFINEIMEKLEKANKTISKYSKITIDMTGLDPEKFNIDQSVYIKIEIGKKTVETETINVIKKISFQKEKPDGTDLDDPDNKNIDLSDAVKTPAGTYYTYISIKQDLADQIKVIQDAISAGIDLSELTGAVSDLVADANNYANRAKDLEKRVTDYLEYFLNKSINFIATGKVLEPILLVDAEDGIHRAAGSYKEGKFTFVPTTMNYELIAPAFKKYIAVLDKNGNVIKGSQKILTKGDKNFSSVEVELTKDAAQIVYAAMDFKGYQTAKVYNVYVK